MRHGHLHHRAFATVQARPCESRRHSLGSRADSGSAGAVRRGHGAGGKKGPTVAALFPPSFVIVTALAVSVWTHEGTIALPKTPLVAALRSAVTGG